MSFQEKMFEFQKKYDVKNKCILNCKILVDELKKHNFNAKYKAVMVLGEFADDTLYLNKGHIVVDLDGELHEASYDVKKTKKTYYFDNLKDILEDLALFKKLKINKKNIIDNFIKFKKIEECLNNNTYNFTNCEKFLCNLQKTYCLN